MTDEFPCIELEKVAVRSVASQVLADRGARAEFSTETENSTEPSESPAIPVLSNIIIYRYEGARTGEMFHGEGVAYFKGGHVYKGGFVNGLMHGYGEYTWADDVKYKGEFESNVPMGNGTITWLDCSTYEGDVCNGIRHGTGTFKSNKTCTVYRGQWHRGQRHGKGTMYYNEEATSWYEGEWENNQRQGRGMRCYPSGDTYEGQWKNSVRHGEGTMKWIQLGQEYSGQWLNGVQHGHGTHTWFVHRIFGSRYPLRNEYKGEFVQGLRHGQGTFVYASGAVYSGCWKNNKKHGQGKFISKNGHIYEGEFIDDHMAEDPASSTISTCALDGLPSRAEDSVKSASLLGSDMALNIDTLLKRIPEAQRRQELRQVELAIMRHVALLRSVYSLYSSLGHEKSPDNTFLLTYLQFWRFLKDCSVHQYGLTLAQLDHLINEGVSSGDVHSPFSTILLRKWISCIVIAAYHIYNREFECVRFVFAECFSKLMKQNIIPNAKNVKGHLYCHPRHSLMCKNYIDRCWEIYQTVPKVNLAAVSVSIMTARHFVWMFKVLGLFNCILTTRKLLEILSLENPAIYSSTHSNLELEALLGCAELKNTHEVGTAHHRQFKLDKPDQTSCKDQMKNSTVLSQLASPQSTVQSSITIISSAASSVKSLEEFKFKATPESPRTEEIQHKEKDSETSKLAVINTSEMELNKLTTRSVLAEDIQVTNLPCRINTDVTTEEQLENRINYIHRFFTHTFFPAYEDNMVCTREMQEERQRQITENKITLEKAKANAKINEQQWVEVEKVKEKLDHKEERSHVLEEQNNSTTTLTSPVTSFSSVDLKQSPTNKKKKRK